MIHLKKRILTAIFVALLAPVFFGNLANAADTSKFDPGRIIDDAVFYNSSTMSASKIQQFLNTHIGWNTSTHRQDTTSCHPEYDQYPDTIICLKDYKEKTRVKPADSYCKGYTTATVKSSAQIIYDVAKSCGINPQALLVILQKENGLVTHTWPSPWRYKSAMGMGCPDYTTCDSKYAGFFNQLYDGARQLKRYRIKANEYSYVANRNNTIKWNPDSSCGTSTVFIKNQATAGLYIYTPYRPNQSALNAGYGTGNDCSSYGNRNFWLYFTDWFGSTRYTIKGSIAAYYNSGNIANILGSPKENESSTAGGGWKQCFDNGCIVGSSKTGYWMVKGSIGRYYWNNDGPASLLGLPLGIEIRISDGEYKQEYQGGSIIGRSDTGYWGVVGGINKAYSSKHYIDIVGMPIEDMKTKNDKQKQCFDNGCIVGSSKTGYWMVKGSIGRYYWNNDGVDGRMELPLGDEVDMGNKVYYQRYQGGYILGRSDTGYWGIRGSIGKYFKPADVATLGVPIEIETKIDDEGTWRQRFTQGLMVGSRTTGYWQLSNALYDYWISIGGKDSRLGLPKESFKETSNGGMHQTYEYGMIAGSSNTNLWNIKGAIYQTYKKLGAYNGTLGFPVGNEEKIDNVWVQHYQNGYIVGGHGVYYEVSAPIYDYWTSLDAQSGKMGMVTGPLKTGERSMVYQHYEKGVMVVNPVSGHAWESKGSIRKVWASLGYQSGDLGFPIGPEKYTTSDNTWSQAYEHGTIITKDGKPYKVL